MSRLKSLLCGLGVFASLSVFCTGQTLIFPQIADGGGFTLELILTNPTAQEDTGTILFKSSSGDALTLTIDGSEVSSVSYSMPPGGVYKLQTDGVGDLKGGYATVTSNNSGSQISGTVIYSFNGMEVSVPSAPLTTEFHVFVERDEGVNSAVALVNTNQGVPPFSSGDITVTLLLLDENGLKVDVLPKNEM